MKKSGNKKGNVRGIFLVSIFILCTALVVWRWFSSNNSSDPGHTTARDSLYQQQRQIAYGTDYVEALKLVKSGDIVVRKGSDMTSQLLRHFNLNDAQYSHAGIIIKENDTVFVYHALGGELNPDQPIQRETLWSYGNPTMNQALGIYRFNLDSVSLKKVLVNAQTDWQQKIPFDTAFDLSTKDRLYCTEFVASCFEQTLNDTTLFHRSELKGKKYIAVDDLTGNSQVKKIESWKY